MSDSFVVEINRQVVGVALRCQEGYRFFASDPRFNRLDRKTFKRARTLSAEVRRYAERLRKQRGGDAAATVH